VFITGRKKDLIITASGKNVAPSVLEDRLREHWLIGECVVVGDQRPYIAALVTLDPAAFARWKQRAVGAELIPTQKVRRDYVLHKIHRRHRRPLYG
jgi:long-chain acyl-CoA synthetase